MIVGVMLIPTQKKHVKNDKYKDEVIQYINGKPMIIDLRDK